jgi:hypothetical protein
VDGRYHAKLIRRRRIILPRLEEVEDDLSTFHKEEGNSISRRQITAERKPTWAEVKNLSGAFEGEWCSQRDNVGVGFPADLALFAITGLHELIDIVETFVGRLHRARGAAIVKRRT